MLKIRLEHDADCGGCHCPIMAGEVAWRTDSGAVGCCQPCCRDAELIGDDRRDVRQYRETFEADRFELVPTPRGKPAPERFENNRMADGSKRPQKVLFSGSRTCITGQADLFE